RRSSTRTGCATCSSTVRAATPTATTRRTGETAGGQQGSDRGDGPALRDARRAREDPRVRTRDQVPEPGVPRGPGARVRADVPDDVRVLGAPGEVGVREGRARPAPRAARR